MMGLINEFAPWLIALFVIIATAAGTWFGGKRKGAKEVEDRVQVEQAERNAEAARETVERIKEREQINDQVVREGADKARDDLRDNWTRPGS